MNSVEGMPGRGLGDTPVDAPVRRAALEAILDHSSSSIQIVDRDGNTTYTNTICRASFGERGVALVPITTPGADLAIPPELRAALAAAHDGRQQVARFVTLHTLGQKSVLADVRLTPLDRAGDEVGEVVLQYEIVSGLDYLLLDIAANKARLDATLDSVQEGIIILDPQGRLLLANSFAHDLYGIAQGRLVGLSLDELCETLRDPIGNVDQLAAAFPSGAGYDPEQERRLEYTLARPRARVVRQTARPIYDRDGTLLGQAILIHDVTAEQAALQARDALLSVASHELRTPLTAIRGYAQMLERDLEKLPVAVPPRAHRHLEAVLRQIERMARLVDELLDVNRLETGHLVLNRERCDLAVLAADVIERLTTDPTRQPHRLLLECPEQSFVGFWDPGQLDQILAILLGNALKYSPAGGTIRLVLAATEAEVRIAVIDEGLGIPEDQLGNIFEPFTRVSTPISQVYTGFGLGLYMTRRLVERHGGLIWAESIEGEGSTFRVVLPRWTDVPAPPALPVLT